MSWRCVGMRNQLALYVGDDLPLGERAAVQLHLEHCDSCRGHLAAIQKSRDALLAYRVDGQQPETASLWPALEAQLIAMPAPAPRRSWLPVGAMIAASLAIATVCWNRPSSEPNAERFRPIASPRSNLVSESPFTNIPQPTRPTWGARGFDPRGDITAPVPSHPYRDIVTPRYSPREL